MPLRVGLGGVSPRRLTALCRKEAAQIVRDPSSILILILPSAASWGISRARTPADA